MTPDEYCEAKAAASGSSFYYSFRFLPPDQRQAVVALYAFCREVDDSVDECPDPEVARARLQWWRSELDRTFAGDATHPVGRALATALARFDLPKAHFEAVVEGMEMDLEQSRYPTFRDLSLYLHRAAGVVGLMTAEVFGYQDRRTLKYAHALGLAFQLTNILRDVREDAGRGRVYLPLEDLDRFGVDTAALNRPVTTAQVRDLFAFQAERAREHYRRAFALLPAVDRHRQRSGLAMAAIYQATLDAMEEDGFRLLERRVALTPLRKLWIAWRTVRRERRHRSGQ